MFRAVPLSIIRSISLYTQQYYMSGTKGPLNQGRGEWGWEAPNPNANQSISSICPTGLLTACCAQAVSKPVWHISLLCAQWKTPDDWQRNCPKHVEFYSKNKFEKSVYLVCFIIRISCTPTDLLLVFVIHATNPSYFKNLDQITKLSLP